MLEDNNSEFSWFHPPNPTASSIEVNPASENNLPELNAETIPHFERAALIRQLAKKIDAGWIPNLDEAKNLVCRVVHDELSRQSFILPGSEQFDDEGYVVDFQTNENFYNPSMLPWQAGAFPQKDNQISDQLEYYQDGVSEVAASRLLGEVRDFDELDGLFKVSSVAIDRMDPEQRILLTKFYLQNWHLLIDHVSYELMDNLNSLLLSGVPKHLEDDQGLGNDTLKILEDDLLGMLGDETGWAFLYALQTSGRNLAKLAVKALARVGDKPMTDNVISRLIEFDGLEGMLHFIRLGLEDEEPASDVLSLLEYAMGDISSKQGVAPGLTLSLVRSTKDFYRLFNMGEYEVAHASLEKQAKLLQDIFSEFGVPSNGFMLDIACGLGDLTKAMRVLQFNAVGLDLQPGYVKSATTKYGGYYLEGDWFRLPEFLGKFRQIVGVTNEEKKFDAAYMLGRSGHHAGDLRGLGRLFHGIDTSLEEGGIYVSDWIDPHTGIQQERMQVYRSFMQRFNLNPAWLNHNFWWVVSNPPGSRVFIERCIFPVPLVEASMGLHGLKVVGRIQEENFDGRGTNALTLITRKVPISHRKKIAENSQQTISDWVSQSPPKYHR